MRNDKLRLLAKTALSILLSCARVSPAEPLPVKEQAKPLPPPPSEVVEALSLSPFYQKYLDVGGFSIVSSEKPSDYALKEAGYLVGKMLDGRGDILEALAKNRVRLVVMAVSELTTDVPEHKDLMPKKFWDKRARGLGATSARPAVSCAEENLLSYPGDPYYSENILIHELAHAVHQMGLVLLDEAFDERLSSAYEQAMASGLWKGTYAAENHFEYWAEGAQSWFDTNREDDDQHNQVDTRAELKEYDPKLAALCEEVFGDKPWRYQRPADRKEAERAHLAGYDPKSAPTFAWSQELLDWYNSYEADVRDEEAGLTALLEVEASPLLVSPASWDKTSILFKNARKTPVKLYWVDGEGKKRFYASLKPGGTIRQQTYSGHVWVLTDNAEKPLATVVAEAESGKFVLE